MFGSSFRIARIAGIDIQIHPSWLIILIFVAWTLSAGFFPAQYEDWSTATYWVVGTLAAILLFGTVLVHELAHALVARRRGLNVPTITLFIFGGVSHLERQPRSAREEFFIAAAGPATSLLIALITLGLWALFREGNEQARGMFGYLSTVNFLLAIFNILPGFPLDGGRVLRSIVWGRTHSFRQATRIAAGVGEFMGYGLMVLGVFILLSGFALNGLWFMLIGWFLLGAARAEASNMKLDTILSGLDAGAVMHEDFATVAPGISVQEAVDRHMLGAGERAVMVANDGAVLGIITVNDVRDAPRSSWAHTPVQQIMTPRERILTVSRDKPALEVLHLLAERGLNQVPVLEEGRMVGMITRRELLERVQLAESLAKDLPDDVDEPAKESSETPRPPTP